MKSIPGIVWLTFLTACLFSCIEKQTGMVEGNSALVLNPIQVAKSVNTIALDSIYESKFVGFAGEESKAWNAFEDLKRSATEKELELLCEHANPAVRCYAFQALVERGYQDCYQMVANHLSDSVTIMRQSGCLGMGTSVSQFYLDVVTPGFISQLGVTLSEAELEELKLMRARDFKR